MAESKEIQYNRKCSNDNGHENKNIEFSFRPLIVVEQQKQEDVHDKSS